jgi:hypothetical protein
MDEATKPIELYQCLECGLHYKDPETAAKYEAWRKQYQSCNLEITQYSMERSRNDRLST